MKKYIFTFLFIVNGSFESGDATNWATTGQVDIVTYGGASDGTFAAGFNGG